MNIYDLTHCFLSFFLFYTKKFLGLVPKDSKYLDLWHNFLSWYFYGLPPLSTSLFAFLSLEAGYIGVILITTEIPYKKSITLFSKGCSFI